MRNWKLTVAVLALVIGSCAAGPEIIRLAGKGTIAGEVAFTHARHAKSVEEGGLELACDKCHHSIGKKLSRPSRSCRNCHKRKGQEPKTMEEVAHELCLGCHQEQERMDSSKSFPTSCPDCHVFKEPETE